MRALLTGLFLILLPALAMADGQLQSVLTSNDHDRLARFDAILEDALDEARSGGDAKDVTLLDDVISGAPQPLAGAFDPSGNWRCRTIKLGGILPLTVYPWFKCKIEDDGAGWRLRKLTGSQRTEGRFYTESDTRLIYVGAGHVNGERPRRYGDDPKENQVAVVERRGRNRILLFFPAPYYESKLDLLVLER